jgi:hypothetical protein
MLLPGITGNDGFFGTAQRPGPGIPALFPRYRFLLKIELRIMNKCIAGLFRTLSTAKVRIRKSGCCHRRLKPW